MLYVDDLVIADTNLDEIGCMKFQLAASLNMNDMGDRHYFLRIKVILTSEGIFYWEISPSRWEPDELEEETGSDGSNVNFVSK